VTAPGWAADAPRRPHLRIAGGDVERLVLGCETALTCLILVMTTNALLGPVFDPEQKAGEGAPWMRLMWLPVYGAIAGLAALRFSAIRRAWRSVLPTAALALFACASMLWSIEPDVTIRRGVALCFTMLFGLYLGARYDWRELLTLLAGVFTALAVGSLLAALGFPRIGVASDINAGDWKGLWYEKNELGAMMLLGLLANLCRGLIAPPGRRWGWMAAAGLCFGLLVMSKAGTSLVCLLLAVGALPTLALVRRGGPLAVATIWLAATVVGVVAAIAWLDPGLLLKAIGKDPTLTGRTEIWEALFRRIAERPRLGYGFAAFWNDPQGPAAYIRKETGWTVPNAHNGWLDTLAQLGWVGVGVLGLYVLAAYLTTAIRSFTARDSGFGLIYLSCLLVLSASESVLLVHHSIKWVLFIAIFTRSALPPGRSAPTPPGRRISASPPRPVFRDPAPPDRPSPPARRA
jgi:O-antigen ligase